MSRFESEAARLDGLLWEITKRLDQSLQISLKKKEEAEPLIVCTSLLRLVLSYAQAVNVLLHEKMWEAVVPLERAIYEMWVEFRYIVRIGDRTENSRRLMVNATMEFSEFAIANRRSFPGGVQGCIDSLRSYKSDYPEIYKTIRQQRGKRRFHWSGLSRSALVKELAPDDVFYQGLSWEVHAVLSPIRDINISSEEEDSTRLDFRPLHDMDEQIEMQAFSVGGMVSNFWNEYATVFGLEQIDIGAE